MKLSAKLFLALLCVLLLRCEGNSALELPENQQQYQSFVLSLHWPNTYCKKPMGCRKSLPQQFTIHGLWPQRSAGSTPCSKDPISDDVLSKHRTDLLEYWPDLTTTSFDKSKPFWKREYRAHGACCTEKFNADEYVERAIRLAKIHNVREYLRAKRIVPDDSVPRDPQKILEAIEGKTGFKADIQCARINRKVYLEEVRICINYNGRTVINCGGRAISCPKNPIIFPLTVSSVMTVDEGVELGPDKNTTDQVMGWKESVNVDQNEDHGFSSI